MGVVFRVGLLLVIFPLLLLSEFAEKEASSYHKRAMETFAALTADQTEATANLGKATKDQAIAGKDQAAETADEARAEEDQAAAEKDRLKEETSEAEAKKDEGEAAEDQEKASSEEAEAGADETAADSEQAESAADAEQGAAAETEADADEAAEAVLTWVPFVGEVADAVGTSIAGALQARAASEEAASAAVESESMAQRAAESQAKAAASASEASEAEQTAAAKASEESAASAKSDEVEKDADEEESEADAARQEKDKDQRLAKSTKEDEAAATEEAGAGQLLARLIIEELWAFIFTLVSFLAVALPAVYVVGKRLFRACRRVCGVGKRLFGACQRLCHCIAYMRPRRSRALAQPLLQEPSSPTEPWQRRLVEPLHYLMVAVALISAMLPAVAPGVEALGRTQLELKDLSPLAPLITQLVRNIFGWSMITFVFILLVEIGVSLERQAVHAQSKWSQRLVSAMREAVPRTFSAVFLAFALSVAVLCGSRSLCTWLPHDAVWQWMGSMQPWGGAVGVAIGTMQATLRARYPRASALAKVVDEQIETGTINGASLVLRAGYHGPCSLLGAGAIMMKRLVAALEAPVEALTLWLAWRSFFVSMGVLTLAWPYVEGRLRQESGSMLQLLQSAGSVFGFLFLVDLLLLLAPRLAARCSVGGRQKSLNHCTRTCSSPPTEAPKGGEDVSNAVAELESPTDYISIHVI